MGVSVFPAPSTSTSVPGDVNRVPKFTYNNSYDLTSLSGINLIDGTGTAMAYRRTDSSIYFVAGGNNNTYKFNTLTNTGSSVSTSVSWSGIKDIVCAYDGTLWASYSNGGNASVETPQYSTDGGVTWTYPSSASNGNYRGFITLVDDGTFPGSTGNAVMLNAGGTAFGAGNDSTSWWLGTTKMSSNVSFLSGSYNNTYNGGRAMFPLRDGDDVKTGSHFIWLGGNSVQLSPFEVARSASPVALRSALCGIRSTNATNRALSWVNSPTVNQTANPSQEPAFTIGKPTTIDSRWIVGACSSSPNSLEIIDYQTASTVGSVALPTSTAATNYSYGSYCANPIYVSATKKLYVLQGGSPLLRMHVYDVTTY